MLLNERILHQRQEKAQTVWIFYGGAIDPKSVVVHNRFGMAARLQAWATCL